MIFLLVYTQQCAHQKFRFHLSTQLTTFIHCTLLPSCPFSSGNHYSVLCIHMFLLVWVVHLFFVSIFHISEILQYLSFSVWLISLYIISFSYIYVFANGRISFFLHGRIILHCIHLPNFFIHSFIHQTLGVLILAIVNNAAMNVGVQTS